MDPPRVFVSYSHKDAEFTQRLVTDLHVAGAEVWVDVEGIRHGNFMQRIDEALERCDWMVLVLTPNALASSYVKDEVYTALNRVNQGYMRAVIPVLASSCMPGTIPPQWDVLQRYDATRGYETALAGLQRAVGLPSAADATPTPTPSTPRRTETVARSTVLQLVQVECKQNLTALVEFWDKVTNPQVWLPGVGYLLGVGVSPDEGEFNKHQRLAYEPSPVWSHLMWQSQASMAVSALTFDEIERVSRLHSDLDTFTARRAELRAAFDAPEGRDLAAGYAEWMQQKQRGRPTPGTSEVEQGVYAALHTFNEKTRAFWNDCAAIHNRWRPYKYSILLGRDGTAPR